MIIKEQHVSTITEQNLIRDLLAALHDQKLGAKHQELVDRATRFLADAGKNMPKPREEAPKTKTTVASSAPSSAPTNEPTSPPPESERKTVSVDDRDDKISTPTNVPARITIRE